MCRDYDRDRDYDRHSSRDRYDRDRDHYSSRDRRGLWPSYLLVVPALRGWCTLKQYDNQRGYRG